MSHKSIQEDLAKITGSIMFGESVVPAMTVGSDITGELKGSTKDVQKNTGSANTSAVAAEDAPAELQGDTVEDSKKGKRGSGKSKFDELYSSIVDADTSIVSEEATGVENPSFSDEIGDFPPAGPDEESAERDDEMPEAKSLADLFRDFADVCTSIADKYAEEAGEIGEGEIISDEGEIPEGDSLAGEAVESTPAPDGVAKMTAKGNMKVDGVKVVKKTASSASSGQVDGGKPKAQADSKFGPASTLKADGSGAAVDGKGAKLFGNG